MKRIGILETASPDADRLALWDIFKLRLAELGAADVAIDFRWANGRTENLSTGAAELIAWQADVLVTAGTPAAAAASRATTIIPIVMATGVGLGTELTQGAAQRNTNVTGISDLPPGVSAKRLQLLCEAVPGAATIAMLADSGNPSSPLALRETKAAAVVRGITIKDYWIADAKEFGSALVSMKDDGIGGFIVAPGALFFAQRKALASLAIEHHLPSMSVRREYAEAGCLMAYGSPIRDNYRQAADYVAQILGGAKPAELAIGQPTEFEFIVNLKTAAALRLTLSPSLLARAEKT